MHIKKIKKSSPLCQKAYKLILEDIRLLGLSVGERIPSIRQMPSKYLISETPIRQAIRLLCEEGYLEAKKRSGLYLKKIPLAGENENRTDSVTNELLVVNSYSPFDIPKLNAKVELSIHLIDSMPQQRRLWQEIKKRFEKYYPNISLCLLFGQNTSLLLKQPVENIPDIIQLGSSNLQHFISQNLILSLPEFSSQCSHFPSYTSASRDEDKNLKALPFTATCRLQMVNMDLLKKIDMNINHEAYLFDDFFNCCREFECVFKKKIINGKMLTLCSQINPFEYLASYSELCFSEKNKTFDWRHDSVLDFFQKFSVITRPQREINMSWPDLRTLFDSGNALFATSLSLFMNDIPQFAKLLPLPIGPDGISFYGVNYHAISIFSKYFREATLFLKFLLTDEIVELSHNLGFFHFLKFKPFPDDSFKAKITMNTLARSISAYKRYGEFNVDYISNFFFPVFDGVREKIFSPSQAVEKLYSTYNVLMQKRGL